MKRKILVIAVIALVAVAVFGSQALADKPETLPTNPDISDLLQSMNQTITEIKAEVATIEAELANVPRVETLSGTFTVEDQDDMHVNYPGVRHVSLSLHAVEAFDPGDYATLYMYFDPWRVAIADLEPNITNTYEFDAERWQINAGNANGVLPIEIRYKATITFPSDQW